MAYAFECPSPIVAAIAGGAKFPVRRVFCVGRNYAEHAREMGQDPERNPPFFFTKWSETVVPSGSIIPYPQGTTDFHYEAELVVAIGKSGRNIQSADALSHVFGYATGLDMTRRDIQTMAREKGWPWDTSKNVEQSAPLGLIHRVADVGHLSSGSISLSVNGDTRQQADLADMIWPVADIISLLSRLYRVEAGDLIYTGTPAGIGPVETGDEILVQISKLTDLKVSIGPIAAD
ncbi:fumarylacetoacetate hydrolase family protein [Kordiimonas pumila]|uniref:Fumarylacetoacetate hydrolase family protein n=1 Tax=Kordiimonas pumila TaxID=2161677 RepID=A0ABV7D6N9_9PROT|nr:fumarylacetoacetate hydrolase family protein [Kordiimonas pumila]